MAESDFNLFIVNTIAANDQRRPAVAELANGDIMVVWETALPVGLAGTPQYPEADIKARIFDADGNEVVGEFRVNQVPGLAADNPEGTDIRQLDPALTVLTNGNVVVTYVTDGVLSVARIFDSSGNPVTSEFALDLGGSIERHPDVTALSDGGFVVTYYDTENPPTNHSVINGRVFNADGTARTDQFEVSQVNADNQQHPVVTELANGDLAFAWQADEDYHIKGRVFDTDGDAVTDEYQVSDGPSRDIEFVRWSTSIAALDNGGQALAYSQASEIRVRILAADGAPIGPSFKANTYDPSDPTALGGWQPDIIALDGGGFLVAWANGSAGIRARVFNNDGTEAVPEFDISPAASLDAQQEGEVDVIQLSDGRLMFTWEEFTEEADGDGTGVEARIMKLPTYDYDTGQFVSVGSESVDDINGILVQDNGQDDLVVALDGNDQVDAGDGDDVVYGDGSNTISALSKVDQTAAKKSDGGNDRLDGGGGKDKLYGGGGKDKIDGGTENDRLFGGDGNDKITGGEGKDKVKGGKGNDKFIFAPKDGKDTITDFGRGKDKLHLKAFDFKSKSDALDAFKDAGKHTTFKADGTKIKLKGFDYDDLGGGDLIV